MRGSSARYLALGVMFAAGWGGAVLVQRPARAESPPAAPAEMAGACTDRIALDANANLVEQVRAYKARLALAEEQRNEADSKVGKLVAKDRAKVVASTDEWARMARDGTLRVRVPCTNWLDSGQFSVMTASNSTTVNGEGRRDERGHRAEMAGLSEAERETLDEVYERVHERTWSAMRAACEGNEAYRRAVAEFVEANADIRTAVCQAAVLTIEEEQTRGALTRVAQLRAASAPISRATTDAERVAYALTEAPQALDDEMVRAFGREKATRAIDNGVVCFDETTYDVRPEGHDG